MNNVEIASRIRRILYFRNEVWDSSSHLDFTPNHVLIVSELTELLLDIIKALEKQGCLEIE